MGVIRVVESELDPRERERWRTALARPTLVARRARPIELEALCFALLMWSAAYASTLALHGAASLWDATWLRAVSSAAWIVTLRAAFTRWRTPVTAWTNGHHLYAWGYVEVEDGVLRAVPLDELSVAVRGRALGIGPIRVRLSAERWSTTLWLAPSELDGLAAALELRASFGADDERRGYRDAAPRLGGARAPWPWSRTVRDASWASAAALIGAVVPWGVVWLAPANVSPVPAPVVSRPYANGEDLRTEYAKYLASDGGTDIDRVDIALDPCSRDPVVVQSVESYLTLALSTPRLGRLHPAALFLRGRPPSRARLSTRCSWEVDPVHGTFVRAEGHWALERDGRRPIERRAIVGASDVIAMIEACGAVDRELGVSPHGLAVASVTLLRAVIARDVFRNSLHALVQRGDSGWSAVCEEPTASTIVVDDRAADPS